MRVECLEIDKKAYADTISTYSVQLEEHEGMSYEEIESAVIERFDVGSNWYENKLELCRPNHDGSAYTVRIREPYLD